MCSFLFNPREYHGLQGDYIGSTGGALSRTYDALITYLSRTNHALILRKKYEIFLVFDGIIYIVYNTMDMEENSKKERGAGGKKKERGAEASLCRLAQGCARNAQCGKRQSRDAISGLQRR